jgi:hypothetical protein
MQAYAYTFACSRDFNCCVSDLLRACDALRCDAMRCVMCCVRCAVAQFFFLFGHLRVLYRYFRVSRAEQQNRQGLRGFLLRDNVSGGETCYQAERKT